MRLFVPVSTSLHRLKPHGNNKIGTVPGNNNFLFAMTSKVWKKRKNFKINREGGRLEKTH